MIVNMCLDITVLPSPGSGECELEDKRGVCLTLVSSVLACLSACLGLEDFDCFLNLYLSLLICEIGFSLPYGTLVTHKEISNR